ncbi:TPR_REGION domain-containing protein [Meloidogyne graminicola]|uniref:TPR_REGION domain-containing protein n=1 Tax=Meloidogyne graminicola TaxID=189291 RepID=A0A8S9ZYK7_9BILA|nr:TPR_REGION domain-containing protein [Meloidogyne graminicola]
MNYFNNNYLNLLKEPKCPKIIKQNLIITELDKLPAYIYRKYLKKFYKPEKALREVFYSITNSSKLDNIEIVANKLFFAFKRSINSNSSNNNINYFIFGIISSLYWRIKGDPINSIKCLRYSLNNSPKEFIDIPLVSLANIYHQAGFLHSALYILENANVYSTIGDYSRALKFYYSTLSLQSNFKPAKDSITALHCLTNGKFLIKEEKIN